MQFLSCFYFVTINFIKAEIAYNLSDLNFNKWLWNTLFLTLTQFNFDCVSEIINKFTMIIDWLWLQSYMINKYLVKLILNM